MSATTISSQPTKTTKASTSSTSSTVTSSKAAIALCTGGVTGAIEALITYPTEYVKTQLQLQTADVQQPATPAAAAAHQQQAKPASASSLAPSTLTARRAKATATAATADGAPRAFSGILDCAITTVKTHGPLGLYRGMSPILVGSMPKQASRWTAYEAAVAQLRRATHRTNPNQKLSMPELSACGVVAGVTEALFAVIPTETVKTKFIVDQQRSAQERRYQGHRGFVRGVWSIVRQDGVSGLYCGVSQTVAKQGLNQGVRFPVQAAFVSAFAAIPGMTAVTAPMTTDERRKLRQQSPMWNGVAGFGAGVVSVMITQPFDVVKTKMQRGKAEGATYSSSLQCWKHVYQNGGVASFYAGQVPRMLRVGLNVGLTFTLFPTIQKFVAARMQ